MVRSTSRNLWFLTTVRHAFALARARSGFFVCYYGPSKEIQFIKGFFPPAIIAAYFREFSSGNFKALDAADALSAAGKDAEQCRQAVAALTIEFDTVLEESFGLSAYVIPAILFAAVAFIVLFIGYTGGLGYAKSLVTKLPPPVRPLGLTLDLVSVAAIFGAFTWIASDAITRNHQWMFHPSDLSWYSLRLIFAVPLGQAIAITWSGNGSTWYGSFHWCFSRLCHQHVLPGTHNYHPR